MKIEINPGGFTDINTAVLYRFTKYIPLPEDVPQGSFDERFKLVKESFSAYKYIYKGSNNLFSENTFTEYDFKYLVDKYKFNDELLPNLYCKENVESLGINNFLSIVNNIVPTLLPSDHQGNLFFGMDNVQDKSVVILEAEGNSKGALRDGIWKIEFYEDIGINTNILKNSPDLFVMNDALVAYGLEKELTIVKPAITITLGPDPSLIYNPSSCYLDIDSRKDPANREEIGGGIEQYGKEVEEITREKLNIVSISQTSYNTEVNLSLEAWNRSENPNRKVSDWFLRNDEFYSTSQSISTISQSTRSEELWMDKRSGTLVGNYIPPIENTPILNRRLEILKSLETASKYTPYRNYRRGEKITYDGKEWESLIDNNFSNTPTISKEWAISSSLTSIFTDRVTIEINNELAGSISPGTSLTIQSPTESREFIAIENLGYKLNSTHPAYAEKEGDWVTGATISESLSDEGVLIKKIRINNWTKPIAAGRIVFCFDEVGCSVTLKLSANGRTYDTWSSMKNLDLGIKDNSIYIMVTGDSTKYYPNTVNNNVIWTGIPIQKEITIYFPSFVQHQMNNLLMRNTTEENAVESVLFPSENSTGFSTTSNFGSGEWTLYLDSKILYITAVGPKGFEFSNPMGEIIYGTTNYSLLFYNSNPGINEKDWIVTVDGEELEFTEPGESIKWNDVNGCNISYTYDKYTKNYTLTWSNKAIVDNHIVRIIYI